MAKKRVIQKTIRIGNRRISQRFSTKESAEIWYNQMYNKKHFQSDGIVMAHGKKILVQDYILGEWLTARKKNYPASTWKSDEQRLQDHVLPVIGNIQINRVTAVHIRQLLTNLVSEKNLAPATRNRVRAVISTVFNDALNRDDPLVSVNPTFGLKFTNKRLGQKSASNLHTAKDCIRFLKAARELGGQHIVVAALGILSGLRKQEMIALTWENVDYVGHVIEVSKKYVQASNRIVQGTKKGENSIRYASLGKDLLIILRKFQKSSDHNSDIDFVLCKKDGSHLQPKTINRLNDAICKAAGLKVTVHGLRHTYGREFAARTGKHFKIC